MEPFSMYKRLRLGLIWWFDIYFPLEYLPLSLSFVISLCLVLVHYGNDWLICLRQILCDKQSVRYQDASSLYFENEWRTLFERLEGTNWTLHTKTHKGQRKLPLKIPESDLPSFTSFIWRHEVWLVTEFKKTYLFLVTNNCTLESIYN